MPDPKETTPVQVPIDPAPPAPPPAPSTTGIGIGPGVPGTASPTPARSASSGDKAAAAKTAEQHKQSTISGATSVAEAVRRVTDAAVAEIQKTTPTNQDRDFTFTGTAGGRFEIRGHGFTASGTVKVGDVQLLTTEWSDSFIAGVMPAGVQSGEVTVNIDENTSQRSYFQA